VHDRQPRAAAAAGDDGGADEHFRGVARVAAQSPGAGVRMWPERNSAGCAQVDTGSQGGAETGPNLLRHLSSEPASQTSPAPGTAGTTVPGAPRLGAHLLPVHHLLGPCDTGVRLETALLAARPLPAAVPVKDTAAQPASSSTHLGAPTMLSPKADHQPPAQPRQHPDQASGELPAGSVGAAVRRSPVATHRSVSPSPPPAPSARHVLVRLRHQVSKQGNSWESCHRGQVRSLWSVSLLQRFACGTSAPQEQLCGKGMPPEQSGQAKGSMHLK
jgi:hypothetical protein